MNHFDKDQFRKTLTASGVSPMHAVGHSDALNEVLDETRSHVIQIEVDESNDRHVEVMTFLAAIARRVEQGNKQLDIIKVMLAATFLAIVVVYLSLSILAWRLW